MKMGMAAGTVLLAATLAFGAGCGDKSGSTTSGGSSESTSKTSTPSKPLKEREDALFAEFMKIAKDSGDDCDGMHKKVVELVKRESATIDEINTTFQKMTPEEKEKKKADSQARQRKYDDAGLAVILCGLKDEEINKASDRIVPATATK